MNAPARLGIFATALVVAFGGAAAAGAGFDPIAAGDDAGEHGGAHGMDSDADDAGDGHGGEHGGAAEMTSAALLPGLAVSQAGYTLRPEAVTLPAEGDAEFEFTIEGPDGQAVTNYRPTHEKEMHLIVVRRDLSAFQHLHPERDENGEWSAEVNLAAAGTYRAYADFAPEAIEETLTLGTDLFVPGEFAPAELPEPADTDDVGGYEVELDGAPVAGEESELTFTVSRAGTPVSDLEPYLAAFGHLVSLRTGDLAYLHTHPEDEATEGERGGPRIAFATTFPTAGSYRLFLNFAHAGEVQTAAFTVEVPRADGSSAEPAVTEESQPDETAEQTTDEATEEPAASPESNTGTAEPSNDVEPASDDEHSGH